MIAPIGTRAPPGVGDGRFGGHYCRVAFLDGRYRFLAGDADVASRLLERGAAQPGYIDPETGLLLLDLDRRDATPSGPAFLVAHFDDNVLRARIDSIGLSYGLSANQTLLLGALVRLGGIREAAEAIGLPYTTARNILAEIKAKTGFSAIAPMVGHMLELISGASDAAHDAIDRHDLFGLTDRQFAIASSMSTVSNRRALADRLGLSEAVLKAELKDIFLILGVQNAGQLARVAAEARLPLASLYPDSSGARSAHILPESMAKDEKGRMIAWSDFGPPAGRPVFILHSTITARAPPMRLVAALHKAGFRPIAVDRPGFGGTAPAPATDDPFRAAARDFVHVCRTLGIDQADIIARGSGQAAVVLAQHAPDLVRRAVLVNPTPHVNHTSADRGPLGAVKRRFIKNPQAVEGMIRLLSAFSTPRRMRDGMIRSFRGSIPDAAAIEDAQFVADYLRATRGFGEGCIAGYIAEQTAWGRGYDVAPLPGMRAWRIVQGAHFMLHDPQEALVYWRRTLPDTPVILVPDAGQMLAYSHSDQVVAALEDQEDAILR